MNLKAERVYTGAGKNFRLKVILQRPTNSCSLEVTGGGDENKKGKCLKLQEHLEDQ